MAIDSNGQKAEAPSQAFDTLLVLDFGSVSGPSMFH